MLAWWLAGGIWFVSAGWSEEPADNLYSTAAGYYSGGDWGRAVEQFREFVRQYSADERAASAQFYLAESLVQLRKFDEATMELESFIGQYADHRFAPRALFRLGETAYLRKQDAQAWKYLERFRQEFPESELLQYALPYLGELALARNQLADAEQYHRTSLEKFERGPLAPIARMQLGIIAYRQSKWQEASNHLQSCLQMKLTKSQQAEVHYWLGCNLLGQNQWEAAAEEFEHVGTIDPTQRLVPDSDYLAGRAYQNARRWEEARRQFGRVIQQWPTHPRARDSAYERLVTYFEQADLTGLQDGLGQFRQTYTDVASGLRADRLWGRALLKQHKYAEAEALFGPLVDDPQDDKDPVAASYDRYYLGAAYLGGKKFPQAMAMWEEMAKTDLPDGLAELVDIAAARTYMGLERYEEAIPRWQSYLAAHTGSAEFARSQADFVICLFRAGRPAEARDAYQLLASEYPDDEALLSATMQFAKSALADNDFAMAEKLFADLAAQSVSPQIAAEGALGLGWCHYHANRIPQAIAATQKIRETWPDRPLAAEAATIEAKAREREGDLSKAHEAYRWIVQKFPQSPQAPAALLDSARLHEKSQEPQQAIGLLRRIAEQYSKFARLDAALYSWAWIEADQGNSDHAQALFRRIYQDYPQSEYWSDAAYRVADHWAGEQRLDVAQQTLDQLLERSQDKSILPHAYYLQAQLLVGEKKWQSVVTWLQKLLDEFPQHTLGDSAQYWIAEAMFQQRDLTVAEQRFRSLADTAAADQPWYPMAWLRQAQIMATRNDWAAALPLLTEMQKRFPNFTQQREVDYLMGRCWQSQGKFNEARQHLERAATAQGAAQSETSALAQWMIGQSYFHQRQFDRALAAFRKVHTDYRVPRWQAAALLEAGKCLEQSGQVEQAIGLYNQLLKEFGQSEFAGDARQRLRTLPAAGR